MQIDLYVRRGETRGRGAPVERSKIALGYSCNLEAATYEARGGGRAPSPLCAHISSLSLGARPGSWA